MKCGALAAVLVCSGCIPTVPHYSPQYPTRSNVESRLDDFPILGRTRREEILLCWGEPDATSDHQRVFIYRWTKIVAVIPGQYSAVPIPWDTLLRVEFDDRGIVTKMERHGRLECIP